jgi:hypothetical protein
LKQGQLLGQRVDLLVLGAGGLGALLKQRLLEQREGLHGLLPYLHARLADLDTQLARKALGLNLQMAKLLLLPSGLFGQQRRGLLRLLLRRCTATQQQHHHQQQVQPAQGQQHPFVHAVVPGTLFNGVNA